MEAEAAQKLQNVAYDLGKLGKSFFFPVGNPLLIEIEGVTLRMKSTAIGYSADSYLIIRYPVASMSISSALVKGRKITVRYIDNGNVFAFQSDLILALENVSALFISYPLRIVRHSLRSARRIDCFLPATLSRSTAADAPLGDGVIIDISGTGCGVTVGGSAEEDAFGHLRIDEMVVIVFKLPGTEDDIRLEATVKRIQRDSEKTVVGLQFGEIEEELKARLLEFVSTLEKFVWDE